MMNIINRILKLSGYEIRKVVDPNAANRVDNEGLKEIENEVVEEQGSQIAIGSDHRPVGRMDFLLEDLKKRGLKCQTVLDVGANVTSWSRMAKNIYSSANFYLIEPLIEMKEGLMKFCEEFENSTYFLAGAGAKKGVLTLTIWKDLAGCSFLPKPDDKLKIIGKQREVEILTIDDLIDSSKMKTPELIKLDVQGFELEALKGAEKTFGYTEVYILEVSLFSFSDVPGMPILSEVVNFMLERDYVVYDFPGFLRRPLDGALGQCDICFVKRNGFLRNSNEWNSPRS
jgi:FkbM family methyltransferase